MFEMIEQRIVALVAGTAAAARRARAVFFRGETLAAAAAALAITLLVAATLLPMFAATRCGGYRSYGERGYGERGYGERGYYCGERRGCRWRRGSRAHLRQLTTALHRYARDNEGRLPPMNDAATAKAALAPYVEDERIWRHPRTGDLFQPNPALSRRRLDQIANPEEIVAFFAPRPGWRGRRSIAFLDGRTCRLPEEIWPEMKRASRIPGEW